MSDAPAQQSHPGDPRLARSERRRWLPAWPEIWPQGQLIIDYTRAVSGGVIGLVGPASTRGTAVGTAQTTPQRQQVSA